MARCERTSPHRFQRLVSVNSFRIRTNTQTGSCAPKLITLFGGSHHIFTVMAALMPTTRFTTTGIARMTTLLVKSDSPLSGENSKHTCARNGRPFKQPLALRPSLLVVWLALVPMAISAALHTNFGSVAWKRLVQFLDVCLGRAYDLATTTPNNSLDRSPDELGCFGSSKMRRRLRGIAPLGQL